MKSVNILSICGSGTVTSSMVAAKLKDRLSEHGYQVSATEAKPTEALNLAQSKRFDIIAAPKLSIIDFKNSNITIRLSLLYNLCCVLRSRMPISLLTAVP